MFCAGARFIAVQVWKFGSGKFRGVPAICQDHWLPKLVLSLNVMCLVGMRTRLHAMVQASTGENIQS
jgi:hypothetical protein